MIKNAFIINCPDKKQLNDWLTNGYVAVYISVKDDKPTLYSCNSSYNMYADMANVRKGDILFIHCDAQIYGVFKADSSFVEDPNVNSIFYSENIHWVDKPSQPNSGWNYHFSNTQFVDPGAYRQLSIKPYIADENHAYENGFPANEIFLSKRKGDIISIPDRWKYPDHARTLRPILRNEVNILIQLLDKWNYDNNNRLNFSPKNLTGFRNINFILDNNIKTFEKIIEGWLLQNMENENLVHLFGEFSSIFNTFQIGYLNGIDIFGYVEKNDHILKYKIIEIKKDGALFPDHFKQLITYMTWVTRFMAKGDETLVEGYLVANQFNNEDVKFIEQYNKIRNGCFIKLIKFTYAPPNYTYLRLGQCNAN